MPGQARKRYTTFLVAVTAEPGARGPGAIVYAAMTRDAAEALSAVRALAPDYGSAHVAIVGSLSTRTAKAIGLKPEEIRPV